MKILDRLALAVGVVAAAFLALRTPVPGKYDPFPTGFGPLVGYLLVVGITAVIIRWQLERTRVARVMARAIGYTLAAIAVGMVQARVRVQIVDARTYDHWPPRLADIRSVRIDAMAPQLRADWGVHMAAHRLTDEAVATGTFDVPATWPLPADVRFAVESIGPSRVRLWSRTVDGTTACMALQRPDDTSPVRRSDIGCPKRSTPPALGSFRAPLRGQWAITVAAGDPVGEPWPQYRRSAARDGGTPGSGGNDHGWRTQVDGPMRASVSVVGDFVLVGSHGTGAITALDRVTGAVRWTHYLPNWIHQDPVSDGRVVVIGFGDNLASFSGRAPSGVAVYELVTGRHLWTGFDEGSVMTSPVIRDSVIVYATGAGIIRKRSLETGRVLDEALLPGMVTMAPPAAVGDTIVFGLDHDRICEWLISSFRPVWCRAVPHLRMAGHSAPSVQDGSVIFSGAGTLFTPSLQEYLALPHRLQWALVRSALFPTEWDEFSGQVFGALRTADGATQWVSPLFANPRLVVGHISGTAALDEGIGVIVLPVADTVVAFDLADGDIVWTARGGDSRGPPLIVDGHVIVAGRTGVIESRDLRTGAVECTITRRVGYDRAGPARAGDLLIFANLTGEIEAIPEKALHSCPG